MMGDQDQIWRCVQCGATEASKDIPEVSRANSRAIGGGKPLPRFFFIPEQPKGRPNWLSVHIDGIASLRHGEPSWGSAAADGFELCPACAGVAVDWWLEHMQRRGPAPEAS